MNDMNRQRLIASVLIAPLIACTTPHGQIAGEAYEPADERRIANLERAAHYPWVDEGACAVREASGEWGTLVERCFHVLDLSRLQFRDIEGRCPVANVDAAAIKGMVGLCLLVQPELAVAAVIIIGVVIIGSAIAAELQSVKKPGCYCRCFQRGLGPAPQRRVATPAECAKLCKAAGGYQCGGEVIWFPPKISAL